MGKNWKYSLCKKKSKKNPSVLLKNENTPAFVKNKIKNNVIFESVLFICIW